jgi:hypothetical protein
MAELTEGTDIAKIPDVLLRRVAHFVAQDAQDGGASLVALRSSSLRMKGAVDPAALADAMRAASTQILSTRRLLLKLKDDPELAKSFVGATTHSAVILSRLVDLSKAVKSAPSSESLTEDDKKNVQAVAVQIIESARGPLIESLKRATVKGEPMYDDPDRLADEVIERLKKGKTYLQVGPGVEVQAFLRSTASERAKCANGPLCLWDVSAIKDFHYACASSSNAPPFSSDLYWSTSSATSMQGVFYSNTEFKGDLSTWDVSNVKMMRSMFANSGIQNSGIAYWNTACLQDASYMFSESGLRPDVDLSKWNTKHCSDMDSMFKKTAIVNSGIGRWDVRAAKTDYMLEGTHFSGDLDEWPMKQRDDALKGVLTRFGTRRTTSRPTRFGTDEPAVRDLRSVFADLHREQSAQRARSADGPGFDECILM